MLSLTLHPFRLADSTPQTSAQVASQLHAAVEAIEALASRHQLPARHSAMQKVRTQIPALAALVDFWWQGVWQDVAPFVLSPLWRQGVQEGLLPLVYWEHQVTHTRCPRRKAKMVQALECSVREPSIRIWTRSSAKSWAWPDCGRVQAASPTPRL